MKQNNSGWHIVHGLLLAMFVLTFTAKGNAMTAPSDGEIIDWPVDQEKSILNNLEWPRMLAGLEKYPMSFNKPSESHILVRVANQWHLIFDDGDWSMVNTDIISRWPFLVDGQFVNEKEGGGMNAGLSIQKDSIHACRVTIEKSFERFSSSARMSTWAGVSCLPVLHASFVSNFAGDPADTIMASIYNVSLWVNSRQIDGIRVKNRHLLAATAAIGSLIVDEPESTREHEAVRLTSSVQDDDSVTLTWEADGDLADYWVRIDVDEGALAISENGKVRLTGIPKTGTWVYCRVISPDGKVWYHKKLKK